MILKTMGVGASALMLASAGYVWLHGRPSAADPVPRAPPAAAERTADDGAALPDMPPQASDRTREEKRFDRYDHDRNGQVSRDEYLAARRKAFARLDTDGDGRLSFDEWAAKSETKFATADADRSGTLTRTEFATTRVQRKNPRRAADCPPDRRDRSDAED